MELYQDQHVLKMRTYNRLLNGCKRLLLWAPTGSGKTVIACDMMAEMERAGLRSLFVVNKLDLIDQTVNALHRYGITPDVIHQGYRRTESTVIVSTIQTLTSRAELPQADLVILDEAHGSISRMYNKLLAHYADSIILGITATPFRTNEHESLGNLYEAIVPGMSIREMMAIHRLPGIRHFTWVENDIDLSRVHQGNGDYIERELQIAVNVRETIIRMVNEWQQHAGTQRTIVFAVGLVHAENICQEIVRRGISAVVVKGDTPRHQRKDIYAGFRSGSIRVIVSVDVLTEGFDERSVECVFGARPTLSRSLYMQMVGRGLRTCPEINKTKCLYLDFVGNVYRFGLVTDPIAVMIENGVETVDVPTPAIKRCHECGRVMSKKDQVCPSCGFVFENDKSDKGVVPTGRMEELVPASLPKIPRVDILHHQPTRIRVNENHDVLIDGHSIGKYSDSTDFGSGGEFKVEFNNNYRDIGLPVKLIIHRAAACHWLRLAYRNNYKLTMAWARFRDVFGEKDRPYMDSIFSMCIFNDPKPRDREDYYNYLLKNANAMGKSIKYANVIYKTQFGVYPDKDKQLRSRMERSRRNSIKRPRGSGGRYIA